MIQLEALSVVPLADRLASLLSDFYYSAASFFAASLSIRSQS